MAALRAGVEVEVREEPEVEARPPRQQPRGEVERDAVGIGPQQAHQADVAAGHERQRRQEVLAELAVGDPRGPSSCGSNDSESIIIGRASRNWTL